jgi:hypothetical protein
MPAATTTDGIEAVSTAIADIAATPTPTLNGAPLVTTGRRVVSESRNGRVSPAASPSPAAHPGAASQPPTPSLAHTGRVGDDDDDDSCLSAYAVLRRGREGL